VTQSDVRWLTPEELSAWLVYVATTSLLDGALVGASDHGSTKALYAKDPDGIEFEVSWLVPLALLEPDQEVATLPLHLEREIARYGAETRGGVGVSVPTA